MPYPRRRRPVKKRYAPRYPTIASAVGMRRYKSYSRGFRQLASDVGQLKNLINVEFKFANYVASTTPTSTIPTLQLLNGMVRGDDSNTRDGRQIRIKSIQCFFRVNMHASATATTVRYMIVIDKQPSAAAFTAADLLDTASAAQVDALRNLSSRRRFVILKDRRLVVNTDYPEKVFRVYKQLDMKTVYDDSDAGSIADIQSNALYLVIITDEATNTPTCTNNVRIRFIDN